MQHLARPSLPKSVLIASVLVSPALSQNALLREGDSVAGASGALTVEDLRASSTNQSGGYGVMFTADAAGNDLDVYWGNHAGGQGAILREEATTSMFIQTQFDAPFGMSTNGLSYVAQVDAIGGATGLESIWFDNTPIAVVDDPRPASTDLWGFFTDAGTTESGTPYFVAGMTDGVGMPALRRGLFIGTTPTAIYESGGTVPNFPFVLSGSAVAFDFVFSANGTHHINELDMESGSSTDDRAMAIDGVGLLLGGSLARELSPVPASVGGSSGENWDNFDFFGINEAGDYMFTGDTDANTASDEFIVRNGDMWLREGDAVDGMTLMGAIEGARLNESNLIAYIWDVEVAGVSVEALFAEQTLLLKEGDAVDWDGDGIIDPGVTIVDFTGGDSLSISADGTVYFTADVDVLGTTVEGYFAYEGAFLISTNYCMAELNSTGLSAKIGATGSSVVAENNFQLNATDLPLNQFGIFVTSLTQGFNPGASGSSNGNICLGGTVGRFTMPSQIVSSGASGQFALTVDLTQIPQGNGFVPVLAGETWNFQAWYRDGVGLGSNFTDGLEVMFL